MKLNTTRRFYILQTMYYITQHRQYTNSTLWTNIIKRCKK